MKRLVLLNATTPFDKLGDETLDFLLQLIVGKPLPADSSTDRRAYFAEWLTGKDNPYFAKAIVNRVWRNFLGRGLVEAEDDLRATNPPSNAELLDALARDFVEHGYDVKSLIKVVPPAGFEPATHGLGNRCSIP